MCNQTDIRASNDRQGKVLVFVAFLLVVLLGMCALAIDIGWICVTKTQLQSSSDAGSLAGGTELLPGLGVSAFRTPIEVQALAEIAAVEFVAEHRAGDAASNSIEPARDIKFGTAKMDSATGVWTFTWGATPYNAVSVTTRRSNVGTKPGDGPLPLIFAPILGQSFSNLTTTSVAVIMPASGIRIPPGSSISSGLSPFAFEQARWAKYWRANAYFQVNGVPTFEEGIKDEDGTDLFYELVEVGNSGVFEPRVLFDDQYEVVNPALHTPENIVSGQDKILEVNIYPLASEAGNFGTVDIGGLDNSTAVLVKQITYGVSEADLALYEDNKLDPSPDAPVVLQGDTGISSGIESSLEAIIGQCRLIVLYSNVVNPGNTAEYTIVEMVGIRIMAVSLRGKDKVLSIQPCAVSDGASVPDYDEEIGEETSQFSPLILAN